MFVVNDYATAVILCIVTMLCWGSWGNTQKLAGRTWRYELFYWDYVVGMLLFSLILCFTLGSIGSEGRPFLEDLAQAAPKALGSVLLGGVIFNASNILLSASVSLAGLAVAFPLGVGLALVLGVVINYLGAPKGDPVILFLGVALIVIAIVCGLFMWFLYNKTRHGKYMYAIGGNEVAAEVAGINTNKSKILIYMLAAILYGVMGFLSAAKAGGASVNTAQGYELEAIAGCTIGGVSVNGGVGKISGILIGVLVFEVLKIALQFLGVESSYTYIVQGLVIIIAVALDLRKYLAKK